MFKSIVVMILFPLWPGVGVGDSPPLGSSEETPQDYPKK